MFDRSGDLLSCTTFEMPDTLNFSKQAPDPVSSPYTSRRPAMSPLLRLFLFNVAKTESSFFFSLYFATLQYLCVFFSPQFERDSTVYVYKLNEDEMTILYKHENSQHSRTGLAHSAQTWASDDGPEGRLEKSCASTHCPVPSSLRPNAPVPSPRARSFPEVGWLHRWKLAP